MTTTLTRGAYARAGSSIELNTGDWRTQRPVHLHSDAPCHSACPAGENPQAWLARVAEGNPRAAWESLVSANPLPAITGRVCHHPCEPACNRGSFDEPIAIHGVERFLGDCAIAQGWNYPVTQPEAGAAEVAVVGGGPAGLSCAYHLLRRGYRVRLFEARAQAGGMLRMALPPYRLPRDVLDREVERLIEAGIRFVPNHRLGREMSLEELRGDFGAVFLAPGTERGRTWNVDGVVPHDLRSGLDLLMEWLSIGVAALLQARCHHRRRQHCYRPGPRASVHRCAEGARDHLSGVAGSGRGCRKRRCPAPGARSSKRSKRV